MIQTFVNKKGETKLSITCDYCDDPIPVRDREFSTIKVYTLGGTIERHACRGCATILQDEYLSNLEETI